MQFQPYKIRINKNVVVIGSQSCCVTVGLLLVVAVALVSLYVINLHYKPLSYGSCSLRGHTCNGVIDKWMTVFSGKQK